MNNPQIRQAVHDRMAQIAKMHTDGVYPGDPVTEGSTHGQLFALLVDTAVAYLMEIEAELADPGPGKSLASMSGQTATELLLTALEENLDEIKAGEPDATPVNGWLMWRVADGDGTEPEGSAG